MLAAAIEANAVLNKIKVSSVGTDQLSTVHKSLSIESSSLHDAASSLITDIIYKQCGVAELNFLSMKNTVQNESIDKNSIITTDEVQQHIFEHCRNAGAVKLAMDAVSEARAARDAAAILLVYPIEPAARQRLLEELQKATLVYREKQHVLELQQGKFMKSRADGQHKLLLRYRQTLNTKSTEEIDLWNALQTARVLEEIGRCDFEEARIVYDTIREAIISGDTHCLLQERKRLEETSRMLWKAASELKLRTANFNHAVAQFRVYRRQHQLIKEQENLPIPSYSLCGINTMNDEIPSLSIATAILPLTLPSCIQQRMLQIQEKQRLLDAAKRHQSNALQAPISCFSQPLTSAELLLQCPNEWISPQSMFLFPPSPSQKLEIDAGDKNEDDCYTGIYTSAAKRPRTEEVASLAQTLVSTNTNGEVQLLDTASPTAGSSQTSSLVSLSIKDKLGHQYSPKSEFQESSSIIETSNKARCTQSMSLCGLFQELGIQLTDDMRAIVKETSQSTELTCDDSLSVLRPADSSTTSDFLLNVFEATANESSQNFRENKPHSINGKSRMIRPPPQEQPFSPVELCLTGIPVLRETAPSCSVVTGLPTTLPLFSSSNKCSVNSCCGFSEENNTPGSPRRKCRSMSSSDNGTRKTKAIMKVPVEAGDSLKVGGLTEALQFVYECLKTMDGIFTMKSKTYQTKLKAYLPEPSSEHQRYILNIPKPPLIPINVSEEEVVVRLRKLEDSSFPQKRLPENTHVRIADLLEDFLTSIVNKTMFLLVVEHQTWYIHAPAREQLTDYLLDFVWPGRQAIQNNFRPFFLNFVEIRIRHFRDSVARHFRERAKHLQRNNVGNDNNGRRTSSSSSSTNSVLQQQRLRSSSTPQPSTDSGTITEDDETKIYSIDINTIDDSMNSPSSTDLTSRPRTRSTMRLLNQRLAVAATGH